VRPNAAHGNFLDRVCLKHQASHGNSVRASAANANEQINQHTMKAPLLRILWLLLVLILPGCTSTKAPDNAATQKSGQPRAERGYAAGQADARKDIQSNRLAFVGWKGNKHAPAFARLLKEKYGATVRMQPKGSMKQEDVAYAYGYNEVMSAEFERRFGKDALHRIGEEAMKVQSDGQRK